MRGFVERLVPEQGFGFIRSEDGREFFFHVTGMIDTAFEEVAAGSRVEFSVTEHEAGDRGDEHPRAVNVRLAEGEFAAVDNEPLPPEKTGA